jgi:hypothetical protein
LKTATIPDEALCEAPIENEGVTLEKYKEEMLGEFSFVNNHDPSGISVAQRLFVRERGETNPLVSNKGRIQQSSNPDLFTIPNDSQFPNS